MSIGGMGQKLCDRTLFHPHWHPLCLRAQFRAL